MASIEMRTIHYLDDTKQTVSSQDVVPDGVWLVFNDGSGEQLRIRASDVDYVQRHDIEDRK